MSAAAVETHVPGRIRFWATVTQRQALLVVLLVIVCVGAGLRMSNLHAPTPSPDERNYTRQANLVRTLGRGAFPVMIEEFGRDNGLPPPTRAGFLYILAAVMEVTGCTGLMAGVWLSCAASVVSLLLVARLGWRFLGPAEAVLGLAFYAVSALPLMTGHRAWQDALVEMLTLALLLTSAEILRGARHWIWAVAFTGTGAVCLTMKEMPTMVFLLLSAAVMLSLFRRRANTQQLVVFSMLWIVAVTAALGWLAYLLGDAKLLVEYPQKTAAFLAGSTYSMAYENGTLVDLLRGFWIVSPLATLCFPLGVLAVTWPNGLFPAETFHRKIAAGLAAIVLLLSVATVIVPHHLNFRYICPVFGPFYLIAGVGFCWAAVGIIHHLRQTERPLFLAGVAVVVLLSAVNDYTTFQRRFIATHLDDLSIRMVETGSAQ